MRLSVAPFLLAASVGFAGCSTASSDPQSRLRDDTGTEWILEQHPALKTVRFALPKNGAAVLPTEATPEAAVLALLERFKDVFGMVDPRAEWTLVRTTHGANATHLRFEQRTRGVPIFGGDWTATIDGSGRLASMSGRYVPGAESVNISSGKTADAIVQAVDAELRKRPENDASVSIETRVGVRPIVYAPKGAESTLAFLTSSLVRRPPAPHPARHDYVVDARSGVILAELPTLRTAYAHGHGASHYPPFNVAGTSKRSFPASNTSAAQGTWALEGASHTGVPIRTISGNDPQRMPIQGRDANGASGPPSDWLDSSTPTGAAVDAQANFAAAVDAYRELYARNSYDDRGGGIEISINRNEHGPTNAFMQPGYLIDLDSSQRCSATFGIGDGAPEQGLFPFGASLDVVAHELTHGVNYCAWGALGTLGGSDDEESNAVDEALADILAEFITGHVEGGTPYVIVRNVGLPGAEVGRDLSKPRCATLDALGERCALLESGRQEPHAAGGVIGYAWYLMTFGGRHSKTGYTIECPLSWEVSSRLWYDVDANQLPKQPDFRAVANATLAVGKRLGLPLDPIACSWVAVKVMTADEVSRDYGVTCSADTAVPEGGTSGGLVNPSGPLICPGQTSLTK